MTNGPPLGPMHPGRVDVIGGGAVICAVLAEELSRRAGISELVVSEHDILDGIAMSFVTVELPRPHSPIGRGSGLKIRTVSVRVRLGAR